MPGIDTFAFAYWEICLLLASVRTSHIFGWKDDALRGELVLAWLSISIVLSAVIASVYSFAGFNGLASYLVAATLLLVILYFRNFSLLKSDTNSLLSIFDRTIIGKTGLLVVIISALCLPVLLMTIRPVDESDSLFYLNYMLNWIDNRTTPYVFYRNYPAFWELAYIPGLAITRSDNFFWLSSLKPVIIVFLSVYCIGREFGLPRRLALIVALNGIALQHFWMNPSGVATLKEDMAHAAGIALIALAAVKTIRQGVDRGSGLLLTLGLALVTVKWNGFFISVLVLSLIALFIATLLSKARKAILVWLLLSFALLFVTTGHYCVVNLLVHGNPFSPYQFNFMNIHFPGAIDPSGTSILESLRYRGVWQALFFPASGISPAGLLFPLTLVSVLISSTCIIARNAISLFRRKPLIKEVSFLAMYILLTWLLYFRTFWSASNIPGDLFYLGNLASLRFVEGTLALSELFLIYLLWRLKISETLLCGLAGLSLASRVAILYARWPSNFGNMALILTMIVSALVLFGLSLVRNSKYHKILCWSGISFFVVFMGPLAVEINRSSWVPWWRDVLLPLQTLPPARVCFVSEPWNMEFGGMVYPVSGNRLQHNVHLITEQEILNTLGGRQFFGKDLSRPDYVVRLRNPNLPNKTELAAFGSRLFNHGFATIAINDFSILLKQTEVVALKDISKGKPSRAWFIKDPRPLLPETSVDLGNAKPSVKTLRKGDLALFGNPSQLYILDGNKLKAVIAEEGEKLLVMNSGELDKNCMAQGLEFTYNQGRWAPYKAGVEPINPDHDFSSARAMNSIGPWEISISDGGTYSIEHLTDKTGPFMRVKATSDARWLVIVGRFPENLPEYTPVMVRGQIRSTCSSRKTLHLYDLNDKGKYDMVKHIGSSCGDWEQLSVSLRMRSPTLRDYDYYAMGLNLPRKGDYFDVRDLSLFKGVFPG